ncbi:MAG: hypothetical protein QXQ81_03560 [Candidatus Thorarchaeota archaeon]
MKHLTARHVHVDHSEPLLWKPARLDHQDGRIHFSPFLMSIAIRGDRIMPDPPNDLVGRLLHLLLSRVTKSGVARLSTSRQELTVVIETDYYPVKLVWGDGVRVTPDWSGGSDITVKTSMDCIVRVASGQSTLLREFLSRRIRVSGLVCHPFATARVYRLLSAALRGQVG